MTSLSWQNFAAVQVIVRLQRQVCEVALNQRAPHARNLLEVVDRFERTILFTIAYDGLRFFQPDAIHHAGQLFRRGRIDADSRTVIIHIFTNVSSFGLPLRRRSYSVPPVV